MIEIKYKFDDDEPTKGMHVIGTIGGCDTYEDARALFLKVIADLDEEYEFSSVPP